MNDDIEKIFEAYNASLVRMDEADRPSRLQNWLRKQAIEKLGSSINALSPEFFATQKQKTEDFDEAQKIFLEIARKLLTYDKEPLGSDIKGWFTANTTITDSNPVFKNIQDNKTYTTSEIKELSYDIVVHENKIAATTPQAATTPAQPTQSPAETAPTTNGTQQAPQPQTPTQKASTVEVFAALHNLSIPKNINTRAKLNMEVHYSILHGIAKLLQNNQLPSDAVSDIKKSKILRPSVFMDNVQPGTVYNTISTRNRKNKNSIFSNPEKANRYMMEIATEASQKSFELTDAILSKIVSSQDQPPDIKASSIIKEIQKLYINNKDAYNLLVATVDRVLQSEAGIRSP